MVASSPHPVLAIGFRIHDSLSAFVAQYLRQIKMALLLVAHLSLFGLFVPELRNAFGNLALLLLLVILFLSPLSKLLRMRLLLQLMTFRRQLGIWFAYLVTVHGVGYLLDPHWFALSETGLEGLRNITSPYSLGVIAYVLTLPLLFTSNNISLKFFRANWRRIQMLVYPVLVFTLLHVFLISRSGLTPSQLTVGLVQTALLLGVYVLLKALATKNFLPFLERFIGYIGEQYGVYQRESVLIQPQQSK